MSQTFTTERTKTESGDEIVRQTVDTKPGIRTTEFWLTIAAGVAGIGLTVWGAVSDNTEALIIGGSLLTISFPAYTFTRGLSKRPPAPPSA